MSDFAYTAINSKGQTVKGSLSASSREAALTDLRNQGAKPLSIEETKAKKSGGAFGLSKGKVKLKDLVIFTRELSTMISAGVPLVRGLDTLQNQMENK
jgi:type IV pilus assembly protein PilC